tara:strand:+ start:2644 stop:2835 length:192 start_codon:yes stop_codon:yes gene_type:complete
MREEIRTLEDRQTRLREYALGLAKDGKNCYRVKNIQYEMMIEVAKLDIEIKDKWNKLHKYFGN